MIRPYARERERERVGQLDRAESGDCPLFTPASTERETERPWPLPPAKKEWVSTACDANGGVDGQRGHQAKGLHKGRQYN